MINIDQVARVVFEARKETPRRGRVPKIYQLNWDELSDEQRKEIKAEVQDVIEALISEGVRFTEVIVRKDAFRSAKKKNGVFIE